MKNRAWAIESGWSCSWGNSSTKDTWTEIWGDGEGAAVKDGAAIVILSNPSLYFYYSIYSILSICHILNRWNEILNFDYFDILTCRFFCVMMTCCYKMI